MFDSLNDAFSYERVFSEYPIHNYGAEHLVSRLEPGEKALDIGAGTGLLSERLEDLYEEVHLLDPSPYMLHIAAKKEVGDSYVQREAEEAFENYSNDEMDVVASNYAFHYVDTPVETLNSLRRILKDDGAFITENSIQESWHQNPLYKEILDLESGQPTQAPEVDVRKSLEESDFDCYEVFTRDFSLNKDDFRALLRGTLHFIQDKEAEGQLNKFLEDKLGKMNLDQTDVKLQHSLVKAYP